jgi:hypothetical protein
MSTLIAAESLRLLQLAWVLFVHSKRTAQLQQELDLLHWIPEERELVSHRLWEPTTVSLELNM